MLRFSSTWSLQIAKSCWRKFYGREDMQWKNLVDLSLVYDVSDKDNKQMHGQMRSLGMKLAAAWGDNHKCRTWTRKNVKDNKQMHGQMRSLGMKLAAAWGDNHKCRTWTRKNVMSTSSNTALEFEEVIALRLEDSMPLNSRSIRQMEKLRYLDSEKELMLDKVGGELSKTLVLLRLRGKVKTLRDLFDRGCECLVVVDLTSPLTCLPTTVSKLQNLEFLNFEACLFKSLPETFGQLPKLRQLTFSSCKRLRSLPKSFGQLSELRALTLHSCTFRALPDSFGQLPSLETLFMHSLHNLQMLPENFGNLSQLKHLSIIGVPNMAELPDSFCHLPRLETLTLFKLDNLQRLPKGFGNLSQLNLLIIAHVPNMAELPESFCHLPRLDILSISSLHNLQRLPECFRNLSELNLLIIEDVPSIAKLPDSFRCLAQLQNLKPVFPGRTTLDKRTMFSNLEHVNIFQMEETIDLFEKDLDECMKF